MRMPPRPRRNLKKPKTAKRLKRYCCAICKKKVAKSESAPYYCPKCIVIKDSDPSWEWSFDE